MAVLFFFCVSVMPLFGGSKFSPKKGPPRKFPSMSNLNLDATERSLDNAPIKLRLGTQQIVFDDGQWIPGKITIPLGLESILLIMNFCICHITSCRQGTYSFCCHASHSKKSYPTSIHAVYNIYEGVSRKLPMHKKTAHAYLALAHLDT